MADAILIPMEVFFYGCVISTAVAAVIKAIMYLITKTAGKEER